MSDRFDLEDQIMRTGNYADQIRDLAAFMIENEGAYDFDKIHNAMVGIAEMIEIHADKMYNTMCDALDLDKGIQDSSQLTVKQDLTNADTPVRTSCRRGCGKCDPTAGMSDLDFIG